MDTENSIPRYKVAVIDMYNGVDNQGMRCIEELLSRDYDFAKLDYQIFDARQKNELPESVEDFDLFLSTGGPGSPVVQTRKGEWTGKFAHLIDSIIDYNNRYASKKGMLLICYSFQLIVHQLNLAVVRERKSASFGITSIYKTPDGKQDPIYDGLSNPFYVADFRDYQVVQPNKPVMEKQGMKILSLEKIRPHIALERAVTGIRFTSDIAGVQFHPEADPGSMKDHFNTEEQKEKIIQAHGRAKYDQIMMRLNNKEAIQKTFDTVIPNFLKYAVLRLRG